MTGVAAIGGVSTATVDVACVGHPFLDLIFRGLAAIPGPGEEQVARELDIVPGAIANVAYALNRLGLEAVVCAPMGNDPAGRLLRELLAEAGVRWIGEPSATTPVSVALPTAGDRAFVTAAPVPSVDTGTLASLEPRAIVVDLPNVPLLPELSDPPAIYAVLGEPEVRALAGNLPATLGHLRALVVNDREACALVGTPDRDAAARTLAALGTTVVVTCGPDGALAAEPGASGVHAADAADAADAERGLTRARAPHVDVEDPTGAGDL
ncbi:MAG TPA: PfkB family carbohydrate kinase, partial [Candidatus Limnocylindrales bacterium]|nr:PfkB family carbohydrate kinase [Candidatus Limnocylindrales bacterium]